MVDDDKPIFKDPGPVVWIDAVMPEWEHGVATPTPVKVRVVAVQMLSRRTGRYRRVWEARREGSLGSHIASAPRGAILRAVATSERKRPSWMATALRKVEQAHDGP